MEEHTPTNQALQGRKCRVTRRSDGPSVRSSTRERRLPYIDGPTLEWLGTPRQSVRFLWLIPITGVERNVKIEAGLEALEQAFERASFNYLDPRRASVV